MDWPETLITPSAEGEEIPLTFRDLEGEGLGYWGDEGIVIEEDQPEVGKLIIMVHELMHAIDDQLVTAGAQKRRTQHTFIQNSPLMLVYFLAKNGFLKHFEGKDMDEFFDMYRGGELPEDLPDE